MTDHPVHAHRILVRVLLAVATVLAVLAVFAVWANRQALNADNWSNTSAAVLQDPAVKSQVAAYLVDELYANVDVAGELRDGAAAAARPARRPGGRRPAPALDADDRGAARPPARREGVEGGQPAHRRAVHRDRRGQEPARSPPRATRWCSTCACSCSTSSSASACPGRLAQPGAARARARSRSSTATRSATLQDVVSTAARPGARPADPQPRHARPGGLPRPRAPAHDADVGRHRPHRGGRGRARRPQPHGRLRRGLAGRRGGASPRPRPRGRSAPGCCATPRRRPSSAACRSCSPPGWRARRGPRSRRGGAWPRHCASTRAPAYGVLAGLLLLIVAWGPIPATRKVIPVLIMAALAALGLRQLRRQTLEEFPAEPAAARSPSRPPTARGRGRRSSTLVHEPPGGQHRPRLRAGGPPAAPQSWLMRSMQTVAARISAASSPGATSMP